MCADGEGMEEMMDGGPGGGGGLVATRKKLALKAHHCRDAEIVICAHLRTQQLLHNLVAVAIFVWAPVKSSLPALEMAI